MKKQYLFIKIIGFLSLVLLADSFAQEQTTQPAKPRQEIIVVYKISEIPIKLEETSSYLSTLSDGISKADDLKRLASELINISKEYSVLRKQTDSVNLEDELTTSIREFQQKWNFLKKTISEWTKEVTSRTEKLEEQKKALLENKNIWLKTDSLARKERANRNIRNKIGKLLMEFIRSEDLVVNEINNSINIQTKISEQVVDVDQMVKKIGDLLIEKKREMFIRNAPPIWQSLTGKADTTTVANQAKYIYDSYVRTSIEFYRENKKSFLSSLFYFLILLVLTFSLNRVGRKFEFENPEAKRALKILSVPFSAATLIYLVGLVIFYSEAPDAFDSLIRILVVLPLLRVLSKIINPILKPPLYLFALLLVLQQFKLTSASDTEIERGLLFLINLITLGGLIWMLITKRFEQALENQLRANKSRALTKLIIGLFIITLIANIVGYVMFSLTIVNGTINSALSITILLTAAIALESVIIVSLKTKLANSLYVVQNQPQKIQQTIGKLTKLIVIIWSISIVLNNFGLREIIINWLEETLANKWTVGSFSFSIWSIVLFIISIWLSVIAARFVKFILDGDVLPRFNLARGVPAAISTISSYLIIAFGILVAIMGAGIDLNSFTMIAGALSVGIGFGLQDIVKNFISGLIIIFEHPIQIGDAVQIEELSGRVKHIGIRSSTIKTWEGAEVIVPNGNLISNKLVNWTLSDQLRRIDIKIGVAYGTDVQLVMETLLNCANQQEKILTSPPPYVLFEDFADSSLNFELRCWTADFTNWVEIRSDIRVSIDKVFKEKNIDIPFPQRDLNIKSNLGITQQAGNK